MSTNYSKNLLKKKKERKKGKEKTIYNTLLH